MNFVAVTSVLVAVSLAAVAASEGPGCVQGGRTHPYGPVANYDDDPCVSNCRCDTDGHVKCRTEMCNTGCPGGARPIQIPGQCCPLCPSGCTDDNGHFYGVGATVKQDICETCICQANGEVKCQAMMCPVLPRSNCDIILKDGDCCPSCKKPEDNLCLDSDTGLHYGHRETHHDDPCVRVSCQGSSVVRTMISCPPPLCPGYQMGSLKFVDGQCCPDVTCPRGCLDRDTDEWYPLGLITPKNDDQCNQCTCEEDGSIACEHVMCQPLPCRRLEFVEGECCPKCAGGCFDADSYTHHPEGSFKKSDCESCMCHANGTTTCEMEMCNIGYCVGHLEFRPNTCCPVCVTRERPGENAAEETITTTTTTTSTRRPRHYGGGRRRGGPRRRGGNRDDPRRTRD